MAQSSTANAMANFADRWGNVRIESTGAKVVSFSDPLYNVSGSSDDPNIGGLSWKQLLIANGINSPCYVTAPPARAGSSHPGFNVGGHMTINQDGSVPDNGICYLMPLCQWHNSTRRNGVPFEHSETTMIELSGYMLEDFAESFIARLPHEQEYAMIVETASGLTTATFEKRPQSLPETALTTSGNEVGPTGSYLLFRQVTENGRVFHVIEDANVPEATQ